MGGGVNLYIRNAEDVLPNMVAMQKQRDIADEVENEFSLNNTT